MSTQGIDRGERNRVGWSVAAAALALALLSPLAYLLVKRSSDMARAETTSWARDALDDATIFRNTGELDPPGNTWLVNPIEQWSDPMGETWIDPPLFTLADAAVGVGPAQAIEFDFEGSWLGYSQWTGGNDVMVTVVSRDPELSTIASARRTWTGVVVGLSALVGLLAFWALGRMQAPVKKAHLVNRDFIADAAHELRTPLSIIQASAGFALARERPADEYRESLNEILEASERAGASVGELLEFARLEAGQASLRLAPLRLDLLVEEVAASVRVDDVTIEALPGEGVVVEADYNLVRQVIDNITRNAAARADKVTLRTTTTGGRAVIEVADDGPGFDPGIIDHVFERFRRGDRSGSVGLGMAIARTIVELHGGTCRAANLGADDGGGAVVTIEFPTTATS